MAKEQLIQRLKSDFIEDNQVFSFYISFGEAVKVYPKSINQLNSNFFFIARRELDKYLYVISLNDKNKIFSKFIGEFIHNTCFKEDTLVKRCPLNHHNAVIIRELFKFTGPVLIGLQNSIGFGDRLGLANPGHLRAISGTDIKPVLAQQSIRELKRTDRRPEEGMDAATWAAFQEGYKEGFGSDADHLKTIEDIDSMVRSGFTMFTFDLGKYVVNEACSMPSAKLLKRARGLSWTLLNDTFENFMSRYENMSFFITDDFSIKPGREQVLRAAVKYGDVIAHTVKLYRHLKDNYPYHPFELELSIDEAESSTSPFEHFLTVKELKRLGINLVSLAPGFVGDFEKAIDYQGNLEQFREEYIKHVKIARFLGPYKISLHSGSDKFSVYRIIGHLNRGYFHIKTSGTSYLEALRTTAAKDAGLFREILDFARQQY
ncbi:MAG: tagaturonate epimerase family protein, partial [Fidelibacterota bacterium]